MAIGGGPEIRHIGDGRLVKVTGSNGRHHEQASLELPDVLRRSLANPAQVRGAELAWSSLSLQSQRAVRRTVALEAVARRRDATLEPPKDGIPQLTWVSGLPSENQIGANQVLRRVPVGDGPGTTGGEVNRWIRYRITSKALYDFGV